METKKIKIMASFDWSMRQAVESFLKFLDPVIRYKDKEYKIEFGNLIAAPIVCGDDLSNDVDFVIDRTTHWNEYYKFWAQQAQNSMVPIINHPSTFFTYDKHIAYDIMARAIHPDDYFPTTVLLPQFHPYTDDQVRQQMWQYEQELIVDNTEFGFDEHRRQTDWQSVQQKMKRNYFFHEQVNLIRQMFYASGNYLQESVEKYFGNKFPIYLKKASGGGGSDVYRVKSLEELYSKYDEKSSGNLGGKTFHLQEAIENYEHFIRCMALGPQILPMNFLPDTPLHEHYAPEKPQLAPHIEDRIINYALFINSYFRWTYNSFEAIVKDGKISPIDFANACPDSNFTSLHVHFPWLVCAIVRWTSFCAITKHDMRIDMEQNEYLQILNDPAISQVEKYDFCLQKSKEYFTIDKFREFCNDNFSDIKERMIQFYDGHFDDIIRLAIHMSEFPKEEQPHFYNSYKNMMETIFRPNAMEYLTAPNDF